MPSFDAQIQDLVALAAQSRLRISLTLNVAPAAVRALADALGEALA